MKTHLFNFFKAAVAPLALGQKMEQLLVTYQRISEGRPGNHEGGNYAGRRVCSSFTLQGG